MSEKLRWKLKFFILILKVPLKLIYKAIAAIPDFFIYKFFVLNIQRFSDLKFLKKIIGNNKNIKNKLVSNNYKDLIYEIINANFDKLNFIDINDKEFIRDNLSISEKEKIIKEADEVCNHEFDLLGSGMVKVDYNLNAKGFEGYVYENKLSDDEINAINKKINQKICEVFHIADNKFSDYEPIDWHIDFKSGYRWDNKIWYKKIKYGYLPGIDIKIPWELSRASHFTTLGQAYWLTSDEKYTKEFICQVIDWIESNPVKFGVNWACTMDTAIRACNWILSFSFFKNSPLINKEFIPKFSKCLYLHGVHIKNNLEKGIFRIKNNHYISDIAGLLYIGLFFNFTRFGNKWLEFAIKELRNEINFQVYEDGTNFEASSFYHRLATELFFYPMFFTIRCFAKFNGCNYVELAEESFGNNYITQVKKMFNVLLNLSDLNGYIPQIGDNDNGKLHIFSSGEIRNMKYLITAAEIFYGGLLSDSFKIKEFDFNQSALWLYGKYGKEVLGKLNESSLKNLKGTSFKNSGWYFLKNNDEKKEIFSSIAILCGPNGQKNKGGHAHNDKLSFSLNINGSNIFSDPGTYIYTPSVSLRNDFRSTNFHNTVCIDNAEQNRFITGNQFILADDSKAKVNKFIENNEYYFFSGEHYGYTRLNSPIIHERQFIFEKKNSSLLIKDIFKGSEGYHVYSFIFFLNPDLKFEINKKNSGISFILPEGKNFYLFPISNLKLNFELEDSFYSGSYGKKEKTFKLKYTAASEKIFDIYFVFAQNNKNYEINDLGNIFNKLNGKIPN